MYKPKLEKDIRCPLEYGMDVFGGKWNSRIICVLSFKKRLRYGELRAELFDVTDAVLAAALKDLLKNGLIERTQYNEIPPHVEYALSERGKTAVPILRSVCRWAGLFYKDGGKKGCGKTPLTQCQKCDYTEVRRDE